MSAITEKEYTFSSEDWFTNNISTWNKYLDKYKDVDGVSYLEVGVYEGRSFVWMLDNILTGKDCHATAVDPLFESFDAFNSNLKVCGREIDITVHRNISQKVLKNLKETSYDIIYIDGSHKSKDILHDLVLSWELLKQDGILIIDDYLWKKDELPINTTPKIAVDSFITIYSDELEILHKDYQVFIRKNINSLYYQELVLINDNFYFWDTNIFGKFDCSQIDYDKFIELFSIFESFEQVIQSLPINGVLSVKFISDEEKNVLKRYLCSLTFGQDKPDISVLSEQEKLILDNMMA